METNRTRSPDASSANGVRLAQRFTWSRPDSGRTPPSKQLGARSAPPAADPSSAVTLWDRAKARFQAADTALAALPGTPDEAHYDRAGTRHDRALVRLLTTPAPHAAALADKLDLLIAHQAWELRAGDACLAAIRADARRFAC